MGFLSPDLSTLPSHPLIIGDSREEAGSGETMAHIYPANGQVTREFAMASTEDLDRAVAAARAALPAWRTRPSPTPATVMLVAGQSAASRRAIARPG